MDNIQFFNQLALKTNPRMNGGRMFSFDFKVYQRTFDDINSKLDLKAEDSVLDLGAGCGGITYYIAQVCDQVALADGAEHAIEQARRKLKKYKNISYKTVDISCDSLPFSSNEFDKVLCYSVVHYLKDTDQFKNLIKELIRVTRPNGKILIGDIPLQEKYKQDLEQRKKNFFKNLILNLKYYFKKYLTKVVYHSKKINSSQVKGIAYTKSMIKEALADMNIQYVFLEQNKKLPSANSREDLLIQVS